ncbi:HisA/HisF-related TIM barrel protein [Pseudomonadales bacterium]|jgi:imidazole glycerol-phosphate synthase subunit HisF|nr:HisA/HisF-related TIM barrel protein [Pseudomonadales bacterium]HAT52180.1 imidazole glycerol phosphate synthase subunit HisF [Betaproteobacteria bacterium]
MLKKRIIPIVLLDGFSVLKTIQFDVRRNLGSPITVMRTYNTRNVDELIILDIDASRSGRSVDKFLVQEISSDCFMPLTVGGGIKTCQDVETLLRAGADKVSVNSCAYKTPSLVKEMVDNFGSQCIVGSVDCIRVGVDYFPFCNNEIVGDISLLEALKRMEDLFVGEVLINDVSRDGTMKGYDPELAHLAMTNINVPVIYAGGINSAENAAKLALNVDVDAIGISSLFHFTETTPEDCRAALRDRGVPAR